MARDRPAKAAPAALLALVADPATGGPMRLTCPAQGSGADAERSRDAAEDAELRELEARVCEAGGWRIWAQQRLATIANSGHQVIRLAVAPRPSELLDHAEFAPCQTSTAPGTAPGVAP